MKALEIKTSDLEYNINRIKERAGETKIIAVLKGYGYGLGLDDFPELLIKNGINYFAVSSVEEAIELQKKGFEATVICLEATSLKEHLEMLLDNNIVITVGNVETAKLLNEIAKTKNKKAHVHFKIDTGFSRYGFLYNDKYAILKAINECTSIFVDGIFSHFSAAYFKNENYTKLQYNRFLEVRDFLEERNVRIPMYHICNSSAFLKYDDMFMNAVRIGSAFTGRISVKNNIALKRIGMLKSKVVEIKKVEKNTPVGYSNSEITRKKTTLAIVPIGYADGFNLGVKNDTFKFIDKVRILKNAIESFFKDDKIYVSINGKRFPVIRKSWNELYSY